MSDAPPLRYQYGGYSDIVDAPVAPGVGEIRPGTLLALGKDGYVRPASTPPPPRSPLLSRPRTEKQDSDEYKSPRPLFEKLDRAFGKFTLDVAASATNHLVAEYLTKADDAPSLHVGTHVCWMNPPYSRGNLARFMGWALAEVQRSCPLFCCLVPAYTSESWWQKNVFIGAAAAVGEIWAEGMCFSWRSFGPLEVWTHFIDGRLSFCEGDEQEADTARYASAVIVYRKSQK